MLILERHARFVPLPPAKRGKPLKTLSQAIKYDGQGWSFHAGATAPTKQAIPRALVLTFQFYDANNTLIDLISPSFTYSEALKSRFAYVPVDAKGSPVRLKPLLPPANAVRIECQLQRWQCPDDLQLDCTLEVEPHEFSIDQIATLEAAGSTDTERIASRLLDNHPTSRQHLLEVLALAWRIGAPRLAGKASRLLEVAPEARGYMRHRARLTLAALAELDDWLPEAGEPVEHLGLPHRVAHLAASADGKILELARGQFERGIEPLILIPSNYSRHDIACGPYTQHADCGVKVVAFTALNAKAVQGVPPTDLARFDVLLAEPCVRKARIGVLHAHVGSTGHELAARALALGKRYTLPVVMNWHNPRNLHPRCDAMAPPPGSEWAELALRQQLRCAQQADAVVVEDGWQAWLLRKQGVPPNRIFVIPDLIAARLLDPQPASSNKPWTAVLDMRDVEPARAATLASALPEAIGRKRVHWHVLGSAASKLYVEQALSEAGLAATLDLETDLQAKELLELRAHIVVRLNPLPQAHRHDWLSDIHDLASSGTLILAESIPQSDYLVRDAGIGLTFQVSSPTSFVHTFSDLAPSRAVSTQLRRNLRALRAARLDADAIADAVDRVYRHALCSLG